jgi:hypothetical protein
MSEEIELAAKTSAEVVTALAEKSGALAVPQEYASYIAARIHLRHYPALIKAAMVAAETIRASGLPRRAFSALDEPLLTKILEGMAEETNPDLQDAWENLLANALTDSDANVPRAFPKTLGELEPVEAGILDAMAEDKGTFLGANSGTRIGKGKMKDLPLTGLVNLERLGLIALGPVQPTPPGKPPLSATDALRVMRLTPFGDSVIRACQAPKPAESEPLKHRD